MPSIIWLTTASKPAPPLNDTDSQGTHVIGCAVANGTTSTMGGAESDNTAGSIQGIAPAASFESPRRTHASGSYALITFSDLLNQTYTTNLARISNHSYGAIYGGSQTPYNSVENGNTDKHIFQHDKKGIFQMRSKF